MAGRRGTTRLPDLYDPEQPLPAPTPLPVYHIDGLGGFIAKAGLCFNTSPAALHLEGKRVRDVLAQYLGEDRRVRRVYPGQCEWHEVDRVPGA